MPLFARTSAQDLHRIKEKGFFMAHAMYGKVTGVIQKIARSSSCCSFLVTIQTNTETVNFAVSGETMVVDNVRLRRGMRVAAFYDTSLPVPAIYPPQYRAELLTALGERQEAALGYFDETLTAEDNSLKLNLSPVTRISTINGQPFFCFPGNQELLVYYTVTTFSIPPQTTPQRILVLCSA